MQEHERLLGGLVTCPEMHHSCIGFLSLCAYSVEEKTLTIHTQRGAFEKYHSVLPWWRLMTAMLPN
jgi:hypothetical protein